MSDVGLQPNMEFCKTIGDFDGEKKKKEKNKYIGYTACWNLITVLRPYPPYQRPSCDLRGICGNMFFCITVGHC